MRDIKFYKLQASGNDFILLDARGDMLPPKAGRCPPAGTQGSRRDYSKSAQKYCARRFGVGADGLLVIEPSLRADFKMRIFNSDGSEAQMCGNGARCAAVWAADKSFGRKTGMMTFDTEAGIIEAKVKNKKADGADAAIKMVIPQGLTLEDTLSVCGRKIRFSFINTGVPHTVVFVQGIDEIDVVGIGREIRHHARFSPAGTNVDFVEILKEDFIDVRTYERGVEDETLACGTGAVASAIISGYKLGAGAGKRKMNISTRSGEVLRVYFTCREDKISDVWLEGKAYLVYKGQIDSV